MSDLPMFDCATCGETTRGNGRSDVGAMLCRDCHIEFITARGDTLELKLASIGYSVTRSSELASDMRALYAVRHDQEKLTSLCESIRLREGMDCR